MLNYFECAITLALSKLKTDFSSSNDETKSDEKSSDNSFLLDNRNQVSEGMAAEYNEL